MRHQFRWNGIRGIVLDAVGTLIRPYPSVADAYTEAAGRQGVVLDPDEVRGRFHTHFRTDDVHAAHGLLSTDEATERRRWRKIVAGVLPEIPAPERAFDELWDHFGRAESWRSFPDAPRLLNALGDMGIAVCVGSNFDGRLRGVVEGLPELSDWACALVISSEVGFRKPHRMFFQAACDRLGLPPEQVLCVGDDVENDVRGAIGAGLRGLLLDRNDCQDGDLPCVPNLTALVEAEASQT
jgi:putative hydrolase of the HAD superfamily